MTRRAPRRRISTVLAALCAGTVLYGLAFPPFEQDWAAWIALVPLLLLVHGQSSVRAFAYGGLYGIACGYGVSYWLVLTLASFFGLSWPLAIGGATLYGVIYWLPAFGLFAAGAARLLDSGRPVAASLAIAALWVATELLRGRILGQPWALLGYSQHAKLALIQVAAVTAVYGVSFLIALTNAALAHLLLHRASHPGRRLAPIGLAATLVAVVSLGGLLVLREPLPVPTIPVAIVQTNVAPVAQWSRAYTDRQVIEHTRATDELVREEAALIVWPENAVPRYLELEPGLAAHLSALATRHGSDLLFGAPRYADGKSHNSVRLITAAGRNGGYYDKQRLVLVAETSPFRSGSSDGPSDNPRQFAAGDRPGVLGSVVPVGVSICHEVLFPELSADAVRAGAQLLVSVSNDGWLDPGLGVAARQHFAMAALRAVETRRYLVRAATTGISGVIDPHGRVVDSLGLGARGALVSRVSARTGLTPYVRTGDVFALGCVLVAVAALLASRVLAREPLDG